MPSMNEIYRNYSVQYDELIKHEDYQDNLKKWIEKNIETIDKSVIEFGVGTGRTTALYAKNAGNILCFDRSEHMLRKCKENLDCYTSKIRYEIRDNTNFEGIPSKADIVIEGWSFGHTIVENESNIDASTRHLIENCLKLLSKNGILIIIETMGSNVEEPYPPSPNLAAFYSLLEKKYGFKRQIIRTDYKLNNWSEAERIFGFSFGSKSVKGISDNKLCIIPEYTGIWYRHI